MAWKVKWTSVAWTDLELLADFISKDSSYYAASFVQEIKMASNSLKAFAERGRVVPELRRADIRELFVGNYRLIYQVTQDIVYILALVHGSRNLRMLWKKK